MNSCWKSTLLNHYFHSMLVTRYIKNLGSISLFQKRAISFEDVGICSYLQKQLHSQSIFEPNDMQQQVFSTLTFYDLFYSCAWLDYSTNIEYEQKCRHLFRNRKWKDTSIFAAILTKIPISMLNLLPSLRKKPSFSLICFFLEYELQGRHSSAQKRPSESSIPCLWISWPRSRMWSDPLTRMWISISPLLTGRDPSLMSSIHSRTTSSSPLLFPTQMYSLFHLVIK